MSITTNLRFELSFLAHKLCLNINSGSDLCESLDRNKDFLYIDRYICIVSRHSVNTGYTRKWYWYFKVPLESATNWHCKYKISVSQELISKYPKGYVMV